MFNKTATASAMMAGVLLSARLSTATPLLLTSVTGYISSSVSTGEFCGDGSKAGAPALAECIHRAYENVDGIATLFFMRAFGSARADFGSSGVSQ